MTAAFLTSTLARLTDLGDKPALRKGTETRTYREVVESCYRFARVLRDAGLRRGDGLVLISRNPLDMYSLGMAVQLLGIRYTPVYAGQPFAQLAHIVADSRARAVVVDGELDSTIKVELNFGLADLVAEAAWHSSEPIPVQAREGDIARVLYTGGTTGAPKGVAFTYEALANAGRAWAGNAPPPGLRFVAMTPLAHAGGAAAFGLLPHGVEVEIFDDFDAAELCRAIDAAAQENRLVTTYLYPSLLYRLLDHPDLPRTNLAGLAFLAYGSAPVLPERVEQAVRVLGPRLRQSYAQTEAIAICALGPEDHAKAASGRPELFA
jgi:fatty-acyl-CoA synthase